MIAGLMGLVAIHQPNFFPWLGYFDKIRRSEVFVFLDDVAYPKSGSGMGSITNRVRIRIIGDARWVGCAVLREPGEQVIRKVRINPQADWRGKMLRSIEFSYRSAPNFDRIMPLIADLIACKAEFLADFNINAIRALMAVLGLTTPLVRQSELGIAYKSTELLIAITRRVAGTAYLCGGGAQGYQQDEMFAGQGVGLVYQNYVPRPYGDPARFIPGLSVIDFLMHAHPEAWGTDYLSLAPDTADSRSNTIANRGGL